MEIMGSFNFQGTHAAITECDKRKYMATVAQISDPNSNEIEWPANHLGHSVDIHQEYYRLRDNAIELSKVSHLLLAVDSGKGETFRGKRLYEIQIDRTNECVTKQKSVQKKSWCKEEEPITLKVFEKHFKSTSLPGKAECQEVQKEYPILRTRHWDHLKHKVRNFKLEMQRQGAKGNLISKNLNKGKIKRKSTEMPL